MTRPLFLASTSPRRRELLLEAGFDFSVIAPTIDEPALDRNDVLPPQLAESISYFKASSATSNLIDGVILAADTIVAGELRVFGKPTDRDDAREILRSLAGTTHRVITGVTLLKLPAGPRLITHDETRVRMRPMSEVEIESYLDSGEWRGKAGAYGIQDAHDAFVECVDGSFSNVVGLPMELVVRELARFGIYPCR